MESAAPLLVKASYGQVLDDLLSKEAPGARPGKADSAQGALGDTREAVLADKVPIATLKYLAVSPHIQAHWTCEVLAVAFADLKGRHLDCYYSVGGWAIMSSSPAALLAASFAVQVISWGGYNVSMSNV